MLHCWKADEEVEDQSGPPGLFVRGLFFYDARFKNDFHIVLEKSADSIINDKMKSEDTQRSIIDLARHTVRAVLRENIEMLLNMTMTMESKGESDV